MSWPVTVPEAHIGPEPRAKMAIYNLLAKSMIKVKIAEDRQNDDTQK